MESNITELVKLAATDKSSELEVKLLSGKIHTREDADRILHAIELLTEGGPQRSIGLRSHTPMVFVLWLQHPTLSLRCVLPTVSEMLILW